MFYLRVHMAPQQLHLFSAHALVVGPRARHQYLFRFISQILTLVLFFRARLHISILRCLCWLFLLSLQLLLSYRAFNDVIVMISNHVTGTPDCHPFFMLVPDGGICRFGFSTRTLFVCYCELCGGSRTQDFDDSGTLGSQQVLIMYLSADLRRSGI